MCVLGGPVAPSACKAHYKYEKLRAGLVRRGQGGRWVGMRAAIPRMVVQETHSLFCTPAARHCVASRTQRRASHLRHQREERVVGRQLCEDNMASHQAMLVPFP